MDLLDHATRRKLVRCRKRLNRTRRLIGKPSTGRDFSSYVSAVLERKGLLGTPAELPAARFFLHLYGRR